MSLKYQQEEEPVAESEHGQDAAPFDRFPLYSVVLIVCYSVVFLVQMVSGLDRSIVLAGDDKNAVIGGHEVWRMLTGATLHGSIIHYAMNTFAFYSFGRTFEMLTARSHLPIVFLLSAIGGAVLSLVVNPHGISVGASGGIIGLVGYLAVYSFKRRQFITAEFRRSLIFNIGFILFYGFVLVSAVDNFAHIGGLVTGAIYALIQVPTDGFVDPREEGPVTNFAGLVSMGVYAATCLFAILVIRGIA